MDTLLSDTEIIKPISDDSKYIHKTLENGLELILVSNPKFPKSAISMGVEIGSFHDYPECRGIAHFVEHAVWLGTKAYPGETYINDMLGEMNGSHNAYTASMATIYYTDFDNGNLEKAIPPFIHMLIDPIFSESGVEREVNAVHAEFEGKKKSDWVRRHELVLQNLTDERVAMFKWGNRETLAKKSLNEDARRFFESYYSSDIMSCIVVTNEPVESAFKVAVPLLNKIPNKNLKNKLHDYAPQLFNPEMENKLFFMEPVSDRHTLHLNWLVPNYVRKNAYDNPLAFVTAMFESTDKNSLYSKLVEEDLIFDLRSYSSELTIDQALLYIHIDLTESGFAKWKHVLERVVSMIRFFEQEPFKKELFEEKKQLAQVSFDFSDVPRLSSLVMSLAADLFRFGVKDILAGKMLYGEEFKPDLVKEAFSHVASFKNFVPFLISKGLKQDLDKTQKYFGTKYSYTDLPADVIEIIKNTKASSEIAFPAENMLVPGEIEMRTLLNEVKNPIKLLDTPHSKVFFKQDSTFKLPKTKIGVTINTNSSGFDLKTWVRLRIASLLFEELKSDLDNHMYEAEVRYGVALKHSHIELTVSGFTDSTKKGIMLVGDLISKFSPSQFTQAKLDKSIDSLKKNVNTILKGKSADVARQNKVDICSSHSFTFKEKQTFLQNYTETVEDLATFWKQFMSKASFYWLAMGNLSERETLKLTTDFEDLFSQEVQIEVELGKTCSLKERQDVFFIREVEEEDNKNNGVSINYQIGERTVPISTLGDLVQTFIDDKFFNELRTKQQLGYVVGVGFATLGKMRVFSARIESCDFGSFHILNQVDEFFQDHLEKLKSMEKDKFAELKESLKKFYLQDYSNLNQEFNANWGLVTRGTFDFEVVEEKLKFLEGISQEDAVEFYSRELVEKRRRVISLVNSRKVDESKDKYLESLTENKIETIILKEDSELKKIGTFI